MKLVNQNPNDPASQSNLSTINNMSTNNQASSVNNNDPNQNLIKDESWRQDMNIQEDQNKFLQIKQRFFLDFDIWDSEQHEVRTVYVFLWNWGSGVLQWSFFELCVNLWCLYYGILYTLLDTILSLLFYQFSIICPQYQIPLPLYYFHYHLPPHPPPSSLIPSDHPA